MTFDDAILLGEVEAECGRLGLSDEVAGLVCRRVEGNVEWARHHRDEGGVGLLALLELASLRGLGVIGRDNEYLLGTEGGQRA